MSNARGSAPTNERSDAPVGRRRAYNGQRSFEPELARARRFADAVVCATEHAEDALLSAAEAGASLRVIAAAVGSSASTVLRAIKRAEARRCDG